MIIIITPRLHWPHSIAIQVRCCPPRPSFLILRRDNTSRTSRPNGPWRRCWKRRCWKVAPWWNPWESQWESLASYWMLIYVDGWQWMLESEYDVNFGECWWIGWVWNTMWNTNSTENSIEFRLSIHYPIYTIQYILSLYYPYIYILSIYRQEVTLFASTLFWFDLALWLWNRGSSRSLSAQFVGWHILIPSSKYVQIWKTTIHGKTIRGRLLFFCSGSLLLGSFRVYLCYIGGYIATRNQLLSRPAVLAMDAAGGLSDYRGDASGIYTNHME